LILIVSQHDGVAFVAPLAPFFYREGMVSSLGLNHVLLTNWRG
jgi:hypothetical protein